MSFKAEKFQDDLLHTISRTWLLIKQHAKTMLVDMDYDLTFEQIVVLHILELEDGLNLGMVADRADRERTTISRMVDGLEKRNLVLRVPDKQDKRQKLLYLTTLGKERLVDMAPLGEKFHSILYGEIKKEDIENTLLTLKKMLHNIEKK